jgi:hypothetical protein
LARLRDTSNEVSTPRKEAAAQSFDAADRLVLDDLLGVPVRYEKSDRGHPGEATLDSTDAVRVAREFFADHAAAFGLEASDVSELEYSAFPHPAPSMSSHVVRVQVGQSVSGLRVWGAGAYLLVEGESGVTRFSGFLAPNPNLRTTPSLPLSTAVMMARQKHGGDLREDQFAAVQRGRNRLDLYDAGETIGTAELVAFSDGLEMRIGWLLYLSSPSPIAYLVDAESAELMGGDTPFSNAYGLHYPQRSSSNISGDNPYNRAAGDPGEPGWPCFNVGPTCSNTSDPNYTTCCSPASSPSQPVTSDFSGTDGIWSYRDPGWNDNIPSTQKYLTSGNNAHVVRNAGPCGTGSCARGSGGTAACSTVDDLLQCKSPLSDFNFTDASGYQHIHTYSPDFSGPSGQESLSPGAMASAFYWVNWVHDRTYALGFTESMKNFQASNTFGGSNRGGVGGDNMVLAAQSGSPYCITGPFSWTPNHTDGDPGLIDMCRIKELPWDMEYAADVIAHEYQHLVSDRMGGEVCAGHSYNTSTALAEGWSDYFSSSAFNPLSAEMQLPAAGSDENDPVPDWETGWGVGVRQNRYDNYSRTFGSFRTGFFYVHDCGEIFAAALYRARSASMRKIHSFDESKFAQYGKDLFDEEVLWSIAEGCGTQAPSFLMARNNLLTYDDYYHIPQGEAPNRNEIWKAMAATGLGLSSCVGGCAYGVGGCTCASPQTYKGVSSCGCWEGANGAPVSPPSIGDASDTWVAEAFDVPKSVRLVENHGYAVPPSGWKLGLSDDGETTVYLPFCFPFFGNGCSRTLRVGANGGIRFNQISGEISNGNTSFPTSSSTAPHIAPLWDDWNPGASLTDANDVYFGCTYPGDDPVTTQYASHCTISWHNITHYSSTSSPSSFQAVLYPSGNIVFQYLTVGYTSGVTVGLNKGNGTNSYVPFTSVPATGNSVAFIYNPAADTYTYERGDSSWWLSGRTSNQLTATDDSAALVSLGFDFPFSSAFGTKYQQALVGTNGAIRLGSAGSVATTGSFPCSASSCPNVAPYWKDLNVDAQSGVYFASSSSVSAATWQNVFQYQDSTKRYTFQSVIFPTGDLVYHYGTLGSGLSPKVGLNDANDPRTPTLKTGDKRVNTTFSSTYGETIVSGSTHYFFVAERDY